MRYLEEWGELTSKWVARWTKEGAKCEREGISLGTVPLRIGASGFSMWELRLCEDKGEKKVMVNIALREESLRRGECAEVEAGA